MSGRKGWPSRELVEQFVYTLIVDLVVSLVVALPVMLALGMLHVGWPVAPALGYWTCFAVLYALSFMRGIFRGSVSRS
jgi:hypothetical protein